MVKTREIKFTPKGSSFWERDIVGNVTHLGKETTVGLGLTKAQRREATSRPNVWIEIEER